MITRELDYFNLQQICNSGQCFRMYRIADDRYSITASDKYVEAIQNGRQVTFDCTEREFTEFWEDYFDFTVDYGKYINAVSPRDKYLSVAAQMGSGIRILRQDLWEMIVSFLISQQNNIVRIRRCIDNICRRYGERKIASNGTEYYSFPTAENLSMAEEQELRGCNLGYRAKYIVSTAKSIASGEVRLDDISRMSYNDARQELLKLYGVGEKVADCICLFALHHMEAFPVDTHIRQALEKHYTKGFPKRRYKGMEGIMQQYIFYYELMA